MAKANRFGRPAVAMRTGEVAVELARGARRAGRTWLTELAVEILDRVGPAAVPRPVEEAARRPGPRQRLAALAVIARLGVVGDRLLRVLLFNAAMRSPDLRVRRASLELIEALRLMDLADAAAQRAADTLDLAAASAAGVKALAAVEGDRP
jgi:hypothetical protein